MTRVPPETLLRGYVQARQRFDEARDRRDQPAAFFALFEALSWAVALDERLAHELGGWQWRERFGDEGRVMAAVRFARNSVHHQWAEAVEPRGGGVSFPLEFPLRFDDYYWRPDLPPPRRAAEEPDYERLLANRPARNTLRSLETLFENALHHLRA